MRPTTRSDSVRKELSTETVTFTNDPCQITFNAVINKLPAWRYVIYARYCGEHKHSKIITALTEFDSKKNELSIPNHLHKTLPSQLHKTFLQIYFQDKKLLTITIYYSTGTILVQGNTCQTWIEEEFDKLKYVMKTTILETDGASDPCLTVAPTNDPVQPPPCSPPPLSSSTVLTIASSTLSSSSGAANTSDPVTAVLCSSTAQVNMGSNVASPSPELNTTSPVPTLQTPQPLAKLALLPALCHSVRLQTSLAVTFAAYTQLKEEMRQMKKDLTLLKQQQDMLHNRQTRLDGDMTDSATKIKNEIKVLKQSFKDDINTISFDQQTLTRKQTATQETINRLIVTKDNHTKAIQDLKKTVTNKTKTMTDIDNTHCIEVLSTTPAVIPSTSLTPPSPTVPSSISLIPPLPAVIPSNLPSLSPPMTSDKTSHSQKSNISTNPACETDDRLAYSVQTQNSYSTLQDDEPTNYINSDNDKQSTDRQDTPYYRLLQLSIPVKVTHLLIGDSVIQGIDENKMSLNGTLTKIYSVSGLTVKDVEKWLQHITPCPTVRRLTVHVGLNSCKVGPVTTDTWLRLLSKLHKSFPSATLQASSIVPPSGRHYLSKAVTQSNLNLASACSQKEVLYIDNSPVFVTSNGAPRQALYRDKIHPSTKGTRLLALNIRFSGERRSRGRDRSQRRSSPTVSDRASYVHGNCSESRGHVGAPRIPNRSPLLSRPPPLLTDVQTHRQPAPFSQTRISNTYKPPLLRQPPPRRTTDYRIYKPPTPSRIGSTHPNPPYLQAPPQLFSAEHFPALPVPSYAHAVSAGVRASRPDPTDIEHAPNNGTSTPHDPVQALRMLARILKPFSQM